MVLTESSNGIPVLYSVFLGLVCMVQLNSKATPATEKLYFLFPSTLYLVGLARPAAV